jgi:gluconate kinase
MKKIYIFIGPPAGGKTSTAHALAEKLESAKVIEVDEIKKMISGSVFGKDDDERESWFKETNNQIKEGLKSFDNIIVDDGFFEKQYIDKILKDLNEVDKLIIEINFNEKEHLYRSDKRIGDDEDSIRRMYKIYNKVNEESKINPNIIINNPKLSKKEIVGLIFNYKKN